MHHHRSPKCLPMRTAGSHPAQQLPTEPVATWGCRIEDLMMKVREKDVLALSVTREMLKTQFWTGLHNSVIKAATRHKYDSNIPFEKLLVCVRTVEHESQNAQTMKEKTSHKTVCEHFHILRHQNGRAFVPDEVFKWQTAEVRASGSEI